MLQDLLYKHAAHISSNGAEEITPGIEVKEERTYTLAKSSNSLLIFIAA